MGLPPRQRKNQVNQNVSSNRLQASEDLHDDSSSSFPMNSSNSNRNDIMRMFDQHHQQQEEELQQQQQQNIIRLLHSNANTNTKANAKARPIRYANSSGQHKKVSSSLASTSDSSYGTGTGYKPGNSFQKALYEKGLEEVEQEGDGNCLFRAVGLQVYGDSDSHMEVRRRCMDFMAKEQSHFAQFVPTHEPFQSYIERKRKDGVHGNNPEIQAISELYNRPIQVFVPSNGATPINIFQSDYKTCDVPIRLAYHDGNHYNAIIDPFLPTAGLGLGLPGLEPGLADKLQMQRAKQESDRLFMKQIARQTHDMELKRAMEESSKLSSFLHRNQFCSNNGDDENDDDDYFYMQKKRALETSDLEETDFELEQMALFHSLQKTAATTTTTTTTTTSGYSNHDKEGNCNLEEMDKKRQTVVAPSTIRATTSSSVESKNSKEDNALYSTTPLVNTDTTTSTEAASSTSASAGIAPTQQQDEYPQTVQELVMNGFELSKVIKAYELIGDNFDDILSFLLSTTSN